MRHPDTNIIVGHTTTTTVKLWLKTLSQFSSGELVLYQNDQERERVIIQFDKARGGTVVHLFTKLLPAKEYHLKMFIGMETFLGSFKTFPSEECEETNFLFSSCLLNHNLLIRKKHRVFTNLNRIMKHTNSAFMMFCGDQIYVDTLGFIAPKDPEYTDYEEKYIANWRLKGAADFFANNCSYMILDDHEIANDFDNSYTNLEENKKVGLQVYHDYQHAHNPDTSNGEYFYEFSHGFTAFFVMDTRTERNKKQRLIISSAQQEKLYEWLERNKDRMKVVVTPVPFIIQPKGKTEKWSDPKFFVEQYHDVIDHIVDKADEKLIFICGDYHSAIHGSFQVVKNRNEQLHFHEFMAGPLNQAMVNPAAFFDEESTIIDRENLQVRYSRNQVESKYTNACHISIRSDDKFYYVQGAWYRAQHQKDAAKIADAEIIKIPK